MLIYFAITLIIFMIYRPYTDAVHNIGIILNFSCICIVYGLFTYNQLNDNVEESIRLN